MIDVPRETLGGSQTVQLGNTLRYINIMDQYGFQTVSWWRGRGLESVNIVGQGWHDYNAACIPCSVPFSGVSTRVVISLRVFVSNGRNHTFRWAAATERLDDMFLGAGAAGADPRILAQGTFSPSYSGGAVHWQDFSLPVRNLPQSFFLYLWRDNTQYGNIHISGNVTVKVFQESLAADWRSAVPYLWTGAGWQQSGGYITVRDAQDQRVWRQII